MVKNELLECLLREKEARHSNGVIYYYTQTKMAYNSNRFEGNRLSEDQVREIFLKNTILSSNNIPVDINDIIKTINHFNVFNYMLEIAEEPLTEKVIKKFHFLLNRGTICEYTKDRIEAYINNQNMESILSEYAINILLEKYNTLIKKSLHDLIEFYMQFEMIHPFKEGNGKVGRLILFKECLNSGIMPFIIMKDFRLYYKREINDYEKKKRYLNEICLLSQDQYRTICKYFQII